MQRSKQLSSFATQFAGEFVAWIFGPRQPHFPDLQRFKRGLRLYKAAEVIPMLMCGDQHIEAPAGRLGDVVYNLVHEGRGVSSAQDHSAVHEHVEGLARVLGQRNQEAVAQSLAVHADLGPK